MSAVEKTLTSDKTEQNQLKREPVVNQLRDASAVKTKLNGKRILSQTILDSISSVLIGMDSNFLVTQWNLSAQTAFGLKSKETVGHSLTSLPIHWDTNLIEKTMKHSMTRRKCVTIDALPYSKQDQTEGFLTFTITRMQNKKKQTIGYLAMGNDITRQRVMESHFAHGQKMESIGQLAAGIAHEINTPTQFVGDNLYFLKTAFEGLTELLKAYDNLVTVNRKDDKIDESALIIDQLKDAADIEYVVENIPKALSQSLDGIQRVANIVQAIKDFSHPSTGELELMDINHALDNTLTVARNEWKYVANISVDYDEHLPLTPCLPSEIKQVFLNIIVNAAHAISEVTEDGNKGKGAISIRTFRDGDFTVIRIGDTGNGIPEHIREKVWNPFFTTKKVGLGTGQGLAITHNIIVNQHHGTIHFETEIGKGTVFEIKLPLTVDV